MQKKCLFYLILLWLVLNATANQSTLEENHYQCKLTNYPYNKQISFFNVIIKGSAIPKFSCDSYDADTVNFVSSSLEQIPTQLFDKFYNIIDAHFSNCGIKYLNLSSLRYKNYLYSLNLSYNALEELNADCFSGVNSLWALDLLFNNIATIDKTAFNSLHSLKRLYLTGNKLRSLDNEVFQPLPRLNEIYLNSNQFQVIYSGLFSEKNVFQYIYLDDNIINVVEEGAFGGNLTREGGSFSISLSRNKLTKLNMEKVKVLMLYLSKNKLEELHLPPWVALVHAENNSIRNITVSDVTKMKLETLRLANNSIISLESIQHFHSLKYLDLSNNNIGPLNVTSFTKLNKLTQLKLCQTTISELPQGVFAHQKDLMWLDLSHNKLERFDFDILPSLSNLFLDGNRLKSINYERLKETFPKLAKMGVSDNNWNCTYMIQVLLYCYEHSIVLIKPQKVVQNQTSANDTLQQMQSLQSYLNCITEESVCGNCCSKNGVFIATAIMAFFMLATIVSLLVNRCQSQKFKSASYRCNGSIDITMTEILNNEI